MVSAALVASPTVMLIPNTFCEAAYDARRRMKHWIRKIGLAYFQLSQPRSRPICPSTTKHLQPRLDG